MTKQQDWHGPAHYQIKVKGRLGSRWSDWFESMSITSERGVTTITGEVADQAALHGLLISCFLSASRTEIVVIFGKNNHNCHIW